MLIHTLHAYQQLGGNQSSPTFKDYPQLWARQKNEYGLEVMF
jgi:hypothetical protein